MPIPTVSITPTPSPIPGSELVKSAGEIVSIWNTLPAIMAILFFATLALAVIALVIWKQGGNSTTALNVIASVNSQKDKDIQDLKAQRQQEHEQHIESMALLSNQAIRSNDLFEAMNSRGLERDKQQQRMVENQDRIAKAFDSLLHEGSAPLQKVASDVAAAMLILGNLDTRTAGWQTALESIPMIRADINARLDLLIAEMAKRSTKPILVAPSTEVPQ